MCEVRKYAVAVPKVVRFKNKSDNKFSWQIQGISCDEEEMSRQLSSRDMLRFIIKIIEAKATWEAQYIRWVGSKSSQSTRTDIEGVWIHIYRYAIDIHIYNINMNI